MKRLIIIAAITLLGHVASAQQLPLFSQYLYNKFLINPAHAGSDGFTSVNLTAREQWLGYSGAPRTYSVSYQTRIMKHSADVIMNRTKRTSFVNKSSGRVGFGGYIFSDKNGLIQKTGFQTSYSYHLWIRDETQLSLGLALNGYHFTANVTQQSFAEGESEPWLNNDLRKGIFVPNADFGVYILNKRFDLGFSAQQLFGSTIILGKLGNTTYKMYRHYYLFGSYNYELNRKNILQPGLLFKTSEELIPQADIGLTYIHDQFLWAGLAYRTSGAIIANFMMSYKPPRTDNTTVFFGYAFDFTTNKIQRVTYGTHEITVALKFGDSTRRYRWLDRY